MWSLFFLAILAVAVNSYVWPQLEFSSRLLGNVKMCYLANAGVERAILEVENDSTEDYDSLHDSWSDNDGAFNNVPLGSGSFSVIKTASSPDSGKQYGLTDEESRININKASSDVLKKLLVEAAGVASDEAESIADSIVDWRDEDDSLSKNGKENGYYEYLSEPYQCKNGSFECPEELLMVGGMTRGIFDKIKDHITIYGDGTVNVNTAGVMTLAALGMDVSLAEKIVAFRDEKSSEEKEGVASSGVFTDASQITDALNKTQGLSGDEIGQLARAAATLGVKSNNFRGTSAGSLGRGNRSKKITFIYDREDKIIKYWREE
jgi:type II secretory pathway component PulK